METTFLVLLIIIVWVSLYTYINKVIRKTDSLKKDICDLRKLIESRQTEINEKESSAPVITNEVHIPILSVELSPEEELAKKGSPVKPKKARKPINYEKYIGENLFGKIGILILIVGVGLFVKYAIDKDWINELSRTLLGFVAGGGLLIVSHRLKQAYRAFSSLLAGGAFAIFYVTVAMAYHYYELFSQPAAFIILVVLTILMSVLATWYNRRELAVIALVGGFISPFLVSNGIGSYAVLFTYVSILNVGMLGLSLYKKWGELPIVCFVSTYLILLGYASVEDLDISTSQQLIHLLLFSTLYYLTFLLPIISVIQTDSRRINQLLMAVVVLNNFFYLFFCLWFLHEMHLIQNIKGAFTLFIALINAGIAFIIHRKKSNSGILYPALTGLALTFVSITIPIQLDGTFITLLWACETVIVLWLFIRLRISIYQYFVVVLLFLTIVSYLTDIEIAFRLNNNVTLFANGCFATGVFTGLALLLFALLMNRQKELFQATSILKYSPFHSITLLVGSAVLYTAFMLEFFLNIGDWYLSQGLMLTFTSAVLLLLLILLEKSFPMYRYSAFYAGASGLSVSYYTLLSLQVDNTAGTALQPLQWATLVVIAAHICVLIKRYYKAFDFRAEKANRTTCFLSLFSTLLFTIAVNNLLLQLSLNDEINAGLSISLSIAGFVQMALGMRLHIKSLRLISLTIFGLVLLKLILVDLWLLPTIGKIIVFIILGIILLVLSFLYQKLKQVLFK